MVDQRSEYSALGVALDELGSAMSAAELHGSYCGVLCAGGAKQAAGWLDECVDELQSAAEASAAARDVFRSMEEWTWRVLASSDMEFSPLLPGDDAPLELRVNELALWCHGYLSGLAFGGFAMPDQLPRSAAAKGSDDNPDDPMDEIVSDFSAISQAGIGTDEDDDSVNGEFALAELVEYVRVGVQIAYEELGTSVDREAGSPAVAGEH